MSVLVTGAAGFVGSHLVEALLTRGIAVVGLDNFDPFYPKAVKERNLRVARDYSDFVLVEGDIRDGQVLASLPEDVDSVIHLAALAGVRPSIQEPERYAAVNLMGTSQLLALARERSMSTFIFASSSSVYGNNKKVPFAEHDPVDRPISPYAATKKGGELLCHTASHLHDMTTICLRFFTVYGPRQRPDLAIHKFVKLLRSGRPIPLFGDGTTSRDYTYIADIIDGLTKAYEWAGRADSKYEIANLGEGRTISLAQMIGVISEEMSVEPKLQHLPRQPGDVDRTYADIAKARELFGYDPRFEFREGVRRFLEWFDEMERNS